MSGYQPLPTAEEQQTTVLLQQQQIPVQQQQQQQQQQFPIAQQYVFAPMPGAQELQAFPQNQGVPMKAPAAPEYNLYAAGVPPPAGAYFGYIPPGDPACPQPIILDPERIKEYLLAREYSLDIGRYIKESWHKYTECWWGYSGVFLLFLLMYYVPYVGPLLAWPLSFGVFIATAHSVRTGERVQYPLLFNAYYFYGPLFLLVLLNGLAISVGLILLVIPGLWAMVALSMSPLIYLEYRTAGLKIMDCFTISYKVINKKFCLVLGYFIVMSLFAISGVLLLGVGILVTFPIAQISAVYAFDDIFGLNRSSPQLAFQCVQC